jgi:hypothetical protein
MSTARAAMDERKVASNAIFTSIGTLVRHVIMASVHGSSKHVKKPDTKHDKQ